MKWFSKMLTSIAALSLIVLVSGCNIEEQQTTYTCTTADRKPIDGTPGTLNVFRVDSGNTISVGYSWTAGLVLHSVCAPAYTEITGTNHYFEWYEYGQVSEKDSVIALSFSTTNFGKEQIEATRKNLPGKAVTEFAEKDTDFDSPARITKLIWQAEFPFSEISAVDNFNNEGIKSATATLGSASKEKRFNGNTAQFDCLYQNNVTNDFDAGCVNEDTLDNTYFSQSAPLDGYISALSASPDYQTEKAYICRELNRYDTTSTLCNQRGL
ncbi:hypothetical protein [Vibrio mediterranei]|uniref:hypothetical protein n=1 Tax=Vibrio mediterranei TaxID=689 RepID=UPI0040685BF1